MKKVCFTTICMCLFVLLGYAQSTPCVANYQIIPLPQQIDMVKSKGFTLTPQTRIVYPANDLVLKKDAQLLADYIFELTGLKLKVSTFATNEHNIELCVGFEHPNKEAYRMQVSTRKITIKGASQAGTFYGIQTLRKAIPIKNESQKKCCKNNATVPLQVDLLNNASTIVFPAVEIVDYPQYAYRGAMLDVARHFFDVNAVKTFIDMLALHNVNQFHWHLTDDQGWRIEIKKYPLLTKKASFRPETAIGHTDKKDGKPHGGYYTQQQIKEIVQYAAERNINIVPEIDMPGHMVAALSAYPYLGCTGGPYHVRTEWGIAKEVLCAGNDSTLQFAKDVISEVINLFPGKYIGIGGDECPKKSWENCVKCQDKIKSLSLVSDVQNTKEQRLQSYFMSEMAKYITQRGRKVCGWDEILEGGVAPNATILSWRGIQGACQAARLGHDAIMCPTSNMYFDYYQSEDRANEPVAFNAYLPIEKVYSFNPIPDMLTPQQAKHIIGVQANLWTEQIKTLSHIQYMMLPRLAAACEVQWSNPQVKDYSYFLQRLPHLLSIYQQMGYKHAQHYFTVAAAFTPIAKKQRIRVALSTVKQAKIYYTTDGSEPNETSKRYKKPFLLKHSATVKAIAYADSLMSDVATEQAIIHQALTKPIKFTTQPNKAYQGNSEQELVNGLLGNTSFHSGRWVGYVGNDMDVIIDLQKIKPINSVSVRTLTEQSNWIFPDRGVTLWISNDGVHFTKVFTDTKQPLSHMVPPSISTQKITLEKAKARYIRILVKSEHSMPKWHYGYGQNAFLFIDEVIVE